MSSIAQNMNQERTNRWLLIGAAVLALLTGVLLFVMLANVSGDDDGTGTGGSAVTGDTQVLVAKQPIKANSVITADMFETKSVANNGLVEGAVTSEAQVVGKVARVDVLQGEQLSTARVGTVEGEYEPGFRDTIPVGRRAASVKVTEVSSVAGLLVPGDRVDVIAIYIDEGNDGNQEELTRVETILQNVEVLAFAQDTLEARPSLNAEGTPIATDSSSGSLGERPEDTDPNENAGTATLSLTPEEVQVVVAAAAEGELTLALRGPADADTPGVPERIVGDLGYQLPRAP